MIKKLYNCLDFNCSVSKETINVGDPIQEIIVVDVLEQICLLSNLNIPDLDQD